MRTLAILVMPTVTLVAGCAVGMSPGAKLRNDVFWEAATQCENRYRTLHLDRIDIDGRISLYADAESRGEFDAFTTCYRQGVNDRVEQRRRAGQPIPDELTTAPTAELE